MKSFASLAAAFIFSFSGLVASASEHYDTHCKQGDCFRHGWVTTGDDYVLNTVCKQGDCAANGWRSLANDRSTYEVTCKAGGCFQSGWFSRQEIGADRFDDEVTCKAGRCLEAGWKVKTGYDLMGGSVTCYQGDCSKFGGHSFWRGRFSHTACYSHDCYHRGWSLEIE